MSRPFVIVVILASLCLSVFLFAHRVPSASSLQASGPIVVELFTSEGCSSCPPADVLLQKFDKQPYPGAQIIVLGEHVDYWNHIGWRDPYSSAAFSERQSAYRTRLGLESVYTPQMVVDGNEEFVGSNSDDAQKAIARAAAETKVPVRLSALAVVNRQLKVHIETAELPARFASADLVLAVALDHAESQVQSGENSGRRLTHVAVVRTLSRVGSITSSQSFARDLEVQLEPGPDTTKLRVIAFLQQPGPGRILGAAEQTLGK
ncbi:MAG TPA: DUF1223 domain-containing protein [Terriglobales bacterium]|nr:DUF1223 domain-containing protein [Terriglobales bacterium]